MASSSSTRLAKVSASSSASVSSTSTSAFTASANKSSWSTLSPSAAQATSSTTPSAATCASPSTDLLPLTGIRVVEMTQWVAGPACGAILADWGADVIKVEQPTGDPQRGFFQSYAGSDRIGPVPPFCMDNRGKRSLVLNLKDPLSFEVLHKLLEKADVFLSNYRLGALERLNLSAQVLQQKYPRLIICNITGFGHKGPERYRAGYDVSAFWSRAGLFMSLTPENGSLPSPTPAAIGDHATGMSAVAGICAALYRRSVTGRGDIINTSLLRTGIYLDSWTHSLQLEFGKLARSNPREENVNPMLNTYPTKDNRWIMLVGLEADRHWPSTCRALGHPEWVQDPKFSSAKLRRRNCKELIAKMDQAFREKTIDEWVEILDKEKVWWARIQTTEEVVKDPQAIATGAFVDIPEPLNEISVRKTVAGPVDFSSANTAPRRGIPMLGEHSLDILKELGYSTNKDESEITKLVQIDSKLAKKLSVSSKL